MKTKKYTKPKQVSLSQEEVIMKQQEVTGIPNFQYCISLAFILRDNRGRYTHTKHFLLQHQ